MANSVAPYTTIGVRPATGERSAVQSGAISILVGPAPSFSSQAACGGGAPAAPDAPDPNSIEIALSARRVAWFSGWRVAACPALRHKAAERMRGQSLEGMP